MADQKSLSTDIAEGINDIMERYFDDEFENMSELENELNQFVRSKLKEYNIPEDMISIDIDDFEGIPQICVNVSGNEDYDMQEVVEAFRKINASRALRCTEEMRKTTRKGLFMFILNRVIALSLLLTSGILYSMTFVLMSELTRQSPTIALFRPAVTFAIATLVVIHSVSMFKDF